jgi:hypothetical protein
MPPQPSRPLESLAFAGGHGRARTERVVGLGLMNQTAAFILLTTLITGCTPELSTSEPQPQAEQAEQPVVAEPAEPQQSPTAEALTDAELLRQCMILFEDPSGEAVFQCDRYTIMVLPVRSGADPESIFARRLDEAKAIFEAVDELGVKIEAVPDPPTREGESAASYRVSFSSGPTDHPIAIVMLLSESDGPTTMTYGIDGRTPTDADFETRLAACTSFVRAIHDADDPKSLVASEEEFMALPANDKTAQTPYQKLFAELQAITKKACACEPGSACQKEAAKELDAFAREPHPGASPQTTEENDQFFAEVERACACADVEC